MTTQLTFTFDEEDEKDKLNRLVHADGAYASLWDMSQWLREHYKYHDEHSQDVIDFIDIAREKLYDIMEEEGVYLDRDWR